MICYLWFATSPPERPQQSSNGSPLFTRGSSPSTLQLVATPNFVQFMQKLLETTQVSQSVMVLSLHYIHRLKERNRFTPAQSGSEFRIAVAGLMMANKFLDEYALCLAFANVISHYFIAIRIRIKHGQRFLESIWKKLIEWSANFLLASILTYMWTSPPMSLGSTFSKG